MVLYRLNGILKTAYKKGLIFMNNYRYTE